jgi:DNA ligase (NAD+)
MLTNKMDNITVKEKNITLFFSSLEVDGLGAGNVKKIMSAGFVSIPQMLAMTEADFLKVPGFKQKMATKIKESIQEKVQKATLPELMHATNMFGRGFGTKKFQLILQQEPGILTDASLSDLEKTKRVAAIEGLAQKTAAQFVNQIPAFLAFLSAANLTDKLVVQQPEPTATAAATAAAMKVNTTHPLYGKHYLMTGFRDKPLIEKLTNLGAEQDSSIRKNTFVVLVKMVGEENNKTAEAKKLGIPIIAIDEFKLKYNL